MTAAVESVELAVVETQSPLPVFTGKDMLAALTAYRELQAALDRAMPDAIIRLDDKPFRKKSYWRAVAVAFNLAVECVTEIRDVYGPLETGGENYGYRVTYRATAKGGRSAIGDGTCTAAEKSKGRMRATEHNVRSHSHTRAYNRAVSNLCGFGEVSAEEIEDEAPAAKPVKVIPPTQKIPPGFRGFWHGLELAAQRGEAALRAAWEGSDARLKKYLLDTNSEGWMALKRQTLKGARPITAEEIFDKPESADEDG